MTPWYKLKRVWAAVVAFALIAGMAVGGLSIDDVGVLSTMAETVVEMTSDMDPTQ